jgi:hypothetical protein
MRARDRSIVTAVVGTLIPEIEPPDGLQSGADAFAAAFVIAQIDRMPAHLRTAIVTLVTLFDAGAIARHRKPFYRLGDSERQTYLASWAQSKLSVQRDFVRFHRSLTIFALYSKRAPAA